MRAATEGIETFAIIYKGDSTNGSYVNHHKIQSKYDLIDNDMITLGKTNFKFKSINTCAESHPGSFEHVQCTDAAKRSVLPNSLFSILVQES